MPKDADPRGAGVGSQFPKLSTRVPAQPPPGVLTRICKYEIPPLSGQFSEQLPGVTDASNGLFGGKNGCQTRLKLSRLEEARRAISPGKRGGEHGEI